MQEVSLLRLNLLRVCYLILAAGLALYVWPTVLHHDAAFAMSGGIRASLLAGLGLTAVLGFRYPLKMVPLLVFELTWKAIYLLAFALPLSMTHQMTPKVAQDVQAVLWVLILIPLIPWGYVFRAYVTQRGDGWIRVVAAKPVI